MLDREVVLLSMWEIYFLQVIDYNTFVHAPQYMDEYDKLKDTYYASLQTTLLSP